MGDLNYKFENEKFSVSIDGEEYWIIDDVKLLFTSDCNFSIEENFGYLRIELEGIVENFDISSHGHIIDSYKGETFLRFSLSNIYFNDEARGYFFYENGLNQINNHYIYKRGLTYGLEFTCTVVLSNKWLLVDGYLSDKKKTKKYKVKLAKKVSYNKILWENYKFTTLKELAGANPALIRHIELKDPDPYKLNETLNSLIYVETLDIHFSKNNKARGLLEIPQAIEGMEQLKKLSLSGVFHILHFPQWFSKLKNLEYLLLTNSQVKIISKQIFDNLLKLKSCILKNNQLDSIESNWSDNLEILDLNGNNLKTLPVGISRLKNIKELSIENNPLINLSQEFINIPNLVLELEKKMIFLDFIYKGADGKGVVPYNDEVFYARNNESLSTFLKDAIDVVGFQKYFEGINKLARFSLGFFTTVLDNYEEIGNNRFGGLPDLPESVSFPKIITENQEETNYAWQFIAQINCASVAHLQEYLPRTGILYFFIEDQENFKPKVIYYDGEISKLKSAREFDNAEKIEYFEFDIFEPFIVATFNYPSLPAFYYDEHYYKNIAPELKELTKKQEKTDALKKMLLPLGEESIHSVNSYVFKQYDSPEIETVDKLKGKPEEWMVLLKVSSDNNPGFCFWDAGEIYFVIHKSDLVKRDFSNVYCGLESS